MLHPCKAIGTWCGCLHRKPGIENDWLGFPTVIEGGQGLPHEVEPRYRKLKIRHIRREKKTAPLARRVHAPACTKDSTVAL